MKKEELLDKLDHAIHFTEEKSVNDLLPYFIQMVNESDLTEDKKTQ